MEKYLTISESSGVEQILNPNPKSFGAQADKISKEDGILKANFGVTDHIQSSIWRSKNNHNAKSHYSQRTISSVERKHCIDP